MKIAVEFVKAGQEWDPNTRRSNNYLILAFGGKQFRVECSEDEMEGFIAEAAGGRPPPEPQYAGPTDESFAMGEYGEELDEDPVEEVIYDRDAAERTPDGDFVFGGIDDTQSSLLLNLPEDEPVTAPVLFDTNELPEVAPAQRPAPQLSPTKQREAHIDAQLSGRPVRLRKQRQQAMRAKAQAAPQRRVSSDSSGNPIVPEEHRLRTQPTNNPAHIPPEVQPAPMPEASDDDLFAQG